MKNLSKWKIELVVQVVLRAISLLAITYLYARAYDAVKVREESKK